MKQLLHGCDCPGDMALCMRKVFVTTNLIMHYVIQIDHKCNNNGKCYPNRIFSKERLP